MSAQSTEDPQRDYPARIGLLAGGGTFPFAVARAARKNGIEVVCAGIKHEVSREIAEEVSVFKEFGLGRLGRVLRFFRKHGINEVSWAGWVRKDRLFTPARIFSLLPDWRMLKIWYFSLRDRQSQTILTSFAEEFEREGIKVAHSTRYCPELLIKEGLVGRIKPKAKHLEDIRFGWDIAQRMADLDVGQSVAVLEKATIAVEGIEGTDRNIIRAGELCRKGGFTVVKLPKKGHDMRFDVPTIGPDTIENLKEAGGAVLAVKAEGTLILEQERVVELADRYGIVVVAYEEPPH
ncbi:MAG: UDP-2,3-diacylglucosamine diphosphatase LpxI [Planctomycetes bacterium]|nr:UDP-2,3-diacylglucosamine diphosphatase LpxI [Planctomycetota bacterium]